MMGSAHYYLRDLQLQVYGVNVASATDAADRSGKLRFANLRSLLWWRFREALDPQANPGITLRTTRG